jgi:hypothetical protein
MAIMLDNAADPSGLRSMPHLSRVTFRRLLASGHEATATSSFQVHAARGNQRMLILCFRHWSRCFLVTIRRGRRRSWIRLRY